MKKLGNQVYQFQLVMLSPKGDLVFYAPLLAIPGLVLSVLSVEILWALLCIPGSIFAIWLFRVYWRNIKTNGLILDKEKNVVSIYKWTWSLKKPQMFDEIPISEIMSVADDITVETERKIVNDGIGAVGMQTYMKKKLETTETVTYTVVFQGKFGTKKVNIWKRDDFQLFFTLYYENASVEGNSAVSPPA
jgi:hypothetical protein